METSSKGDSSFPREDVAPKRPGSIAAEVPAGKGAAETQAGKVFEETPAEADKEAAASSSKATTASSGKRPVAGKKVFPKTAASQSAPESMSGQAAKNASKSASKAITLKTDADDYISQYSRAVTPLANQTIVPGDIPAFEDTPERRAKVLARKKSNFRRKLRDWGIFTGYLTPSLVGVLVFFFMPLLLLLKTSFQKSPTNSDFVGFRNYERVLTNEAFMQASENTLTFALMAVPLAVVLSLIVALVLNSGIPGKSIFRSILLNPMMVPVASVVLIWQVFFSYNGVFNGFTAAVFGLDKIDWLKSSYSQVIILLMFLWKNIGYNMVLFLAALNSIPTEILESAEMDGAGPVRRFFAIKLHYLNPTIFFVGIMSLINSFKIFREVYLLTGDYPFDNLYMLQHFMNNAFKHLDYSKLSAGAIVMCVAMIIIVGLLFFAESKFDSDVEE